MDQQQVDLSASSATSGLASLIQTKFSLSRTQRVLQEQLWIEAMQNFNGEYGPSVTFREGASSVFVNITQMKTMAAYSRVMAILAGASGFPWDVEPTPHPELVKMGLTPQAAQSIPELDPAFKQEITAAKTACDGMRNRIDDDLTESHWEEKLARGVLDLVTMGTMVFKGPIATPSKPKKWVLKEQSAIEKIKGFLGMKVQESKYVLASDPDDEWRATMEWLSPFEFYPDPGAYSMDDAMWCIHRHVMSKAQVVELARGKGFDADEIATALDQNPDGNWYSEPWEGFMDIINRRSQAAYLSSRYTVLEYWGYLSSRELSNAGYDMGDDNDANKLHLCNIWIIGNYCVKISVSSTASQRIPFFIVPYEKVPYKIWGRGLPEKMADPQAIINASSRAMVENMGMAAGPQVIYDVNRVMPGTKVDQIVPWGIWAVKNIEGITEPPVRFQKIDPILAELKVIQDIFRAFVNEVTSIPDMSSGMNSEHNRTMGGMSMLFGAADSYIKSVIFNVDNYLTKPMIRALYDWEMQYCPDPSIKGDMTVKASGVQGLMAKELTSQRLAELLQAVGQIPGGADYINMPELMKEVFRALDVINDNVILSDQEVMKKRQQDQQSQVQQQAQIAQVQNLPKPKAQTTPADAVLQILEKTPPADPIYPIMYGKLLSLMNELDPQSAAALEMMKHKNILENKAFADQQELAILEKDIEMSQKLGVGMPPGGQAPQPTQMPPNATAMPQESTMPTDMGGMNAGQ